MLLILLLLIIKVNIINNKQTANPAGIYLLKVNNRNTRTRCEICSKLTIYLFQVSNRNTRKRCGTYFTPFSSVSIVDFEQVNVSWAVSLHQSY